MKDFQRYLIEEFAEEYLEGRMPRREMLRRVLLLTGSIPLTASVLTSLGCNPGSSPTTASAPPPAPANTPAGAAVATPAAAATPVVGPDATVVPDDPALDARMVDFPGKGGTVMAYLAKPKATGTFPGVIVIHENMGLQPHIQEVTRRIAKLGFVALGVDLCSRGGGTAALGDQAQISAFLGRAEPADFIADLQSGIDYLKAAGGARRERFGVFGFCFGGGYTYRLALASADIVAGVPFYGPTPPLDQVPNLRGAISAVYAGNDARINASIPELEAAMKANNKRFTYTIYPDVNHGFHRGVDQPGAMDAAKKGWQQMVDFMTKELKS